MVIDIEDLIKRLKSFKEKHQENFDEDDDFLLAVVLAVLKSIKE